MNDELDESKLKDNVAALIAKLTGVYVFASDGYVYPPDYNYQNNKSGDKWLSSRILGVDDEKYDATWIIYKYTNENYTINILKCNAFSYPELLEQINRMKYTIE